MEWLTNDVTCNCLRREFPDGTALVMVSNKAIFRRPGWENQRRRRSPTALTVADPEDIYAEAERLGKLMEMSDYVDLDAARKDESAARAVRRARSRVRDLAMSTDFKYFVTLTLDGEKVDRYDPVAVTKKLNTWLDNAVRRQGLTYVLVPELHKDGAIHFHGFFNDALEAVDSGTLTKDGGRPRKPKSAAQRAALLGDGWRPVYNLPRWSLGFTTAIELYGERSAAVGYVCKYISKSAKTQGKVGGRWYYSGGDLREPRKVFCQFDMEDALNRPGASVFEVDGLEAAVAIFTDQKGGEENGL